jgi:hypothetical protein
MRERPPPMRCFALAFLSCACACAAVPAAAPPSTKSADTTTTPSFEVFDCPGVDTVAAFQVGETVELQVQQAELGDENAEKARFLWTLQQAPAGVDVGALDGTTRRALLDAKVAGDYQVCFTSDQGVHDCCTLSAVDGFRAQSLGPDAIATDTQFILLGTTTSADDAEIEGGLQLWVGANQGFAESSLALDAPSGVGRFADEQRNDYGNGVAVVEFARAFDATSGGRVPREGDTFTWHLVAEPDISGGDATLDVPVTLAPRDVAPSVARIVAAHIERDAQGAATVVIDGAEPHDAVALVDVGGYGLSMETDPVDSGEVFVLNQIPSGQRVGLRPWSQEVDSFRWRAGPVFFVTAP